MAAILEFGPFRLDADAGILFRGAEPTSLGQRAVLLLALLVRRAGEPVSKSDLIEAAWPALAVEDSNLTVQIAAVRRALADASGVAQWIETLPRRGYRYVGPAVTAPNPDRASGPSLTLPDRPSIAVLPFANLSGDAEQDYFADGMVDDIITGLSRINWLFVIARNSTFTYKGRAVDVKQVGRELGVRYVLEGSVRKTGGNTRITGQLIDTSTGMHVWAERYDRQSEDIFALQDDIAMSVVGAIAPSLRRAEINRVKRQRPDSLDAYDLVLRAQPDVDSGMPEQVTQALVLLERAIAFEPSYALAHGNAAMCHHCLFLRAGLQETSRAASIKHARSAIAHGQDDALALTLAGFSIGMDGHDRSAAFTALDAALAISPSSALTYILGSVMLGWGGDADRAIEWSERGMRLSPFDSWAFAAFDAQAMGHFHRGRFEEACRAAYRSVQANPRHSITHVQLAAALAKLGRLQEARAAATRVLELHPTFRYGRQFQGVNCAPALAASLGEALRAAGLPE
ncbi:winged helix-turn-helix domain-containing protein [Bradyrhizobium sp. GCM10027634]|uniref:winged helix-turn-helix domain-containing protein n=1 Tax=unclassified Bradyrhizobium TaxID=2631580 RepID=UPI00188A94F6|nr:MULTISPECIES: winged helix-turn-helix domain-containing protein [unclassified Bradyrhizobium]MDN5004709.1 winged helix-turn-helix domain-containing protein [Bradyrhizobium sp. WYCCWR 12677]QOZ45348.1 transcriptional regulator [Bradyrhizobium sp. CCBAU 53340]